MQRPTFDPAQLVFRDAVESDIPYCLALDSEFQTEHVWQMTVQDSADHIQISCRRQRLPRRLDSRHVTVPERLELALRSDFCFIVIQDSVTNHLLGFITLRVDNNSQVAYLQDIVIDRGYRRRSLGSRLVHVARIWASEFNLGQIIFEIPTTNYPCILFAQALGFTFCGFNDHHFTSREIAVFFSQSI
ncbi:MAG: GNAT family N-acetyltransferase [Chloroflexi bacterium]|nr:GNAT family N-acetyltransferase [Chloroflexota bacterium]